MPEKRFMHDQSLIHGLFQELHATFGIAGSEGEYPTRADGLRQSALLLASAPELRGCIFYTKEDAARIPETSILTITYVPSPTVKDTFVVFAIRGALATWKYTYTENEHDRCFHVKIQLW
jgi:hypothetical protein